MAQVNANEEVRKNAATKTEEIYNKYKKTIWGVMAAVVAAIGLYIGYQQLIYLPKCAEAQQQSFQAESWFQQGDFELALNGDGNALGFADIISQYGTKSGKAVYLYAGICELQLGNCQEAVGYLKKYNGKDDILKARGYACLGDAYVGLEDYPAAISAFRKAVGQIDNVYTAGYLKKLGLVYEQTGETAKALECYEQIKDFYPQSIEGYTIDKYIKRVQATEAE